MNILKSRLAMGAAIVAIVLGGLGYLAGERQGTRKQARLIERINATERVAAEIKSQISATESTRAALTSELDLLRKEKSSREAVEKTTNDAPPYIASALELADETARIHSVGGLVLPKRFYIVAGQNSEIYWKGIVLARDPETFVYDVACTCTFAANERRRVALTPPADANGSHTLTIVVSDTKGGLITRQQIELVIVPKDSGKDTAFEMLMVGDSLGHQSRFPNRLAQLLARPDNPRVAFVGSHRPGGSEIAHEQYGGWRFITFMTAFGEDPKNYHTDRSPFVFGKVDGKPMVDVQRYLDETLKGARPRNIHIQLGINDGFALNPESADLDAQLSQIIEHAEALIAALRKALPDSVITVGSVIQANATDRAFVESYLPYRHFHSEWRWRQVQMKLARLMVDHFERASARKIFLVPTHMTVDPLDGYTAHVWTPEMVNYTLSNAVHPSHAGDKQLATAIYGVVKGELGGLLK